jgi:lipoprotein-anchoring transpeptidase ErfK/SrfK
MKKLALVLAATTAFALGIPAAAAASSIETPEAKMQAASAADIARADMIAIFGERTLKPNQYLWRKDAPTTGEARVVISLFDQLAYLYRGDELVAVSTISSGKPGKDTPTGIFPIQQKKVLHHSRKYDDAPMPFMQRLDQYGIALHAGHNPGEPASHGCVRLPKDFAARLFTTTDVGTPVLIGA